MLYDDIPIAIAETAMATVERTIMIPLPVTACWVMSSKAEFKRLTVAGDRSTLLWELRGECSSWAGINACHAENTFRVVELFPIQVQYRDLHWTCGFAFFAV